MTRLNLQEFGEERLGINAKRRQKEREERQKTKDPEDLGGIAMVNGVFSSGERNPTSGPFEIEDNFVIILLHRGVTTKITTLNRINSFRTLLFMGNGNGIISHGKGKSSTY